MPFGTVIIVDDDQFVRSTLSAGLSAYGISTVGAYSDALSTIECLKKCNPDVAILDLDLGQGPSGIDIAQRLRKEKRDIGLILLTSYSNPRLSHPGLFELPRGCRFITKGDLTDFSLLVNEILFARKFPLAETKSIENIDTPLTQMQLEVLKMIASGSSSQEIADIRHVSLKAVESMITKIYKALELTDDPRVNKRVQLARKYFSLIGKLNNQDI